MILRNETISALMLLVSLPLISGFAGLSTTRPLRISTPTTTTLHSTPTPDDIPSQSRLEGNRREPTIAEISIIDDMITKLLAAPSHELPRVVSKAIRVVSSPRFFLRIAERTDMATSDAEKDKLSELAGNLVSTLEAVVSTTEKVLDDTALDVENIVKAAAEPLSGEFLVPLLPERIASMREVMDQIESPRLDEGFLTTIDSWMNKSGQDGMDGMVVILQKVLQIYAGTVITRARNTGDAPSPAAVLFEELLNMDTDNWDFQLRNKIGEGEELLSSEALMAEIQRTIESVVLGLENGSMAQRVQAEYLRELITRVEAMPQE
uniref:Uncharacterized protein n=1 Tax=Proboscia inermis TaxID=420281 RepID=A0A6T8FN14_9STRA|mmetsp:Transcript_12431/g.12522  ORF Transcript_12431/g.12522 Transcript_12431/m.12522 type:complete len:321 (+) Transcript_12431:80-1042(+)